MTAGFYTLRKAATYPKPPWTKAQLYTSTEVTSLRVVDGLLNGMSGLSSTGDPIPNSIVQFPLAPVRNGDISDGQSLDTGDFSQNGTTSSPGAPYDIKMPNAGLKAAPAGNAYGALLTPMSPFVDCAESNNSAFGFTTEGETNHTTMLLSLADIALSRSGIPIANNKWATSCCAKNGIAIAGRVQGSTLWNYCTDQLRGQYAEYGTGYELRLFRNFDGEADALNGTTYAAFKSAQINGLSLPVYTLARQLTSQTTPVFSQVWQEAFDITLNNGPALAQYDCAIECPIIDQVGPMWHLPRYSDNLHFIRLSQVWWGHYSARAAHQRVNEGRRPDVIRMLSVRYDGTANKIKIAYSVPTLPLVIDTAIGSMTAATFQNGYVCTDEQGNVALSSFSVSPGGDEIWMTPDRTPVGNWNVSEGLINIAPGIKITGGATCNVRDSTTDTFVYPADGQTYPLYHLVPHYQMGGQ